MKPTQKTDAIRNIRRKYISFLSICLIVMLGVGGFFATRYMDRGMERAGEAYCDQQKFKDYEIITTAGLDEKDIRTIEAVEGVEAAEGAQNLTASLRFGEERETVQMLTMTEKVSIPQLVSGSMPRSAEECLVGAELARDRGIREGDRVKLSLMDASVKGDLLAEHSFTVSGMVYHPEYLRQGVVKYVVVPREAINEKVTEGLDARAYVRLQRTKGVSMFDQDYFQKNAGVRQRLETVTEQLQQDGTQRMRDMANEKIDVKEKKARKKLKEGKQKLDDGEAELNRKLAEGEKKLRDGEKELKTLTAQGEKKLREARQKLKKARRLIKKGERKLKQAKKKQKQAKRKLGKLKPKKIRSILNEALELTDEMNAAVKSNDPKKYEKASKKVAAFFERKDVDRTIGWLSENVDKKIDKKVVAHLKKGDMLKWVRKQLKSYRKTVQKLIDAPAKIAKGERKLKKARKKLAAGEKKYAEGKRTLAAKKKEGREKLDAGWEKYRREKAKQEERLEKARSIYDAKKEKAERKIREARETADSLEGHAALMDLRSNGGYVDYQGTMQAVIAAGRVFGFLFILVGAMVCFSTLAMIIEEQKKQVGTTKAFGFHNDEILKKYLVFGVSAALVGGLLGIGLALGLANFALHLVCRNGQYIISSINASVSPVLTVVVIIIAVITCALVTVLACMGLLRSPASILMKGETARRASRGRKDLARRGRGVKSGRSLYSRLILRNMRDDRARVVMTILIIAGSCFIIGTGFSVRMGFTGMQQAELDQVYNYDTRVDLGSDVTEDQQQEMERYLREKKVTYGTAAYQPLLYDAGGWNEPVFLVCADPKDMGKIYTLRDPRTGENVELPEEGILIQSRMQERGNVKPGDTIELYGPDLTVYDVPVAGFFQNYQGRAVAMSDIAYEKLFGQEPYMNRLFLTYGEADREEILQGLREITENISFEEKDAFKARFRSVYALYNVVVFIMIGIAIVMSFMILMNLTNIFVSRKKREVIVMQVNGFSRRQATGYLVRETVFVTAVGLLAAVVIGMLANPFIIRVLELPDIQMIRTPSILLWGGAAVLEGLFAFIINYRSFRKVKDFELREIAES